MTWRAPLGVEKSPPEESEFLRWASGFYLALALAAVVWLGLRGVGPDLLWGKTPTAQELCGDVALGFGLAAMVLGLWRLVARRTRLGRDLEQQLRDLLPVLNRQQRWGLALSSGLAEELFFRGALQSAWGLLPSAMLFGLLHTGRSRALRLWTVLATAIGLAFGGLVLWRANMVAVVIAHVVINGSQLARLAPSSKGSRPSDSTPIS